MSYDEEGWPIHCTCVTNEWGEVENIGCRYHRPESQDQVNDLVLDNLETKND